MNNLRMQTMIAGCCVCAALVVPRPSLAAPPVDGPNPRTVKLEVDVEALGDKGIGLDQTVRNQLGPQITGANFELVTAGDGDAAVTLRVRFRALQSGDYDYGVHFEFIDHGRREPAIEWVDCHMCVDARLLPVLDTQTPGLLAALDARVSQVVLVPAPVPAPVIVQTSVGDGSDESVAPRDLRKPGPEPRAITGVGIGGAIATGLGVGALIWGSVELSRGVVGESTGSEFIKQVDHRPAGYALIAAGTISVVGGVFLLAVDLGQQSKKREQFRAGQARLYPLLTPNSAGFGVTGKF